MKDSVRVSFNVDPELHARFDSQVHWGSRGPLMRKVFELLTNKLEIGGYLMIAAIMAGEFDPLFERKEEEE